jgi:hypothetical protein
MGIQDRDYFAEDQKRREALGSLSHPALGQEVHYLSQRVGWRMVVAVLLVIAFVVGRAFLLI